MCAKSKNKGNAEGNQASSKKKKKKKKKGVAATTGYKKAVEVEGIVAMGKEGFAFIRVLPKEEEALPAPSVAPQEPASAPLTPMEQGWQDAAQAAQKRQEEQAAAEKDTRDSLTEDIFVAARHLRGALNGDKVRVAITRWELAPSLPVEKRHSRFGRNTQEKTRRREGEVIQVLERSATPYIGILQLIGKQAWVIVESKFMPYDVEVPRHTVPQEARSGQKVAVRVTDWPRSAMGPQGEIVDILGEPGENNTEMHAILTEFGLPYRFPAEVEAAAAELDDQIPEDEIRARRDFRDICTFTIDPADAKDFDDAISYRPLPGGHVEVGVHIADVSYYVRPGDVIDKDAYARGTSVYLVDRTVPMLPERLCNQICSLRAHEDKLCFSAVFELNTKAKVVKSWLGRTVIHSNARLSYEEAQAILDAPSPQDPALEAYPLEVREALPVIKKLGMKLRDARFAQGSIAFDRPEVKVIVDAQGKPIDVVAKVTAESNWLIEEFMLLANQAVAERIGKPKGRAKVKTFVYRIHESPAPERVENFRTFMHHIGQELPEAQGPRQWSGVLNQVLLSVKDRPEASAIEIMALRSMARAVYSTRNVGHYGLAFDYYTHFTSPIRRYPDLMVHRLLAKYLDGGKSVSAPAFEDYCKHCSQREQLATEAERASTKYKMAEFLMDKTGQVFQGKVSGITEWGMYVELDENHIEGMIPLRDIKDDYFLYNPESISLRGKVTGRTYTLGQAVTVRLVRVNLEQKLIDYALVEEPAADGEKQTRTGRKKSAHKGNYKGAPKGASRKRKNKNTK